MSSPDATPPSIRYRSLPPPLSGQAFGRRLHKPIGTLSRPLQFFVLYSFLIAAKGESFMARMAGYRPDMSATTIENTNAPTAR